MRIAIASLMHESNTFVATPTTRADFGVQVGDELVRVWADAHHEVGGFLEGALCFGYEAVPLLAAAATPAGLVEDEVLAWWLEEFAQLWKSAGELDGLLLALHGAMVIRSFPDGDGEVARRVRALIGNVPLVITHDFHANISEQLVAACDALVVYQTNPHVDQRQRGLRAAELIAATVRGAVRPTMALARPPMIWNILHQNTSRAPLAPLMLHARELETLPGVLSANVVGGYQYADVQEVGPSVVVVTDNDAERAQVEADRLAQLMWNLRVQLAIDLPDAAEAVRQARLPIPDSQAPVVLVEMGDNIGGGSPGDSTLILGELVRQQAEGWLVVVCDSACVQQCESAGISAQVSLQVGGKTDGRHGAPVAVNGRVVNLHDGKYEEPEPRHGGGRFLDQGRTAVLEMIPHPSSLISHLVLNSKRTPPFSLCQLTSLGLDPGAQRIIVVKAAVAFRAAYEPIAGPIIEVDTPGVTAVNPLHFDYRRARRPLWPLNDATPSHR